MISECDLDGNGNLDAPRQPGRRLLPAEGAIISVDDHVIEHPRVWLDRLPAKYSDVVPHREAPLAARHVRPLRPGREAGEAIHQARLGRRRTTTMRSRLRRQSGPISGGSGYEFSDGNAVLMRAPYASIARSMFFEAMWPTRKARASRSRSPIMQSRLTRVSAYSGEISLGEFMQLRVSLSAL